MLLKFSENSVLLLQELCKSESSPGLLAKALRKKPSYCSRLLKELEEKGLILRSGRQVLLSNAAHAQQFKQLYDSRYAAGIHWWLKGAAIELLVELAGTTGMTYAELAKKLNYSRPTLNRAVARLQEAGVLFRKEERVSIGDMIALKFATAYADSLAQLLVSQCKGHNFFVRIGKKVVLRTDAIQVPEFFTESGMTFLCRHGLSAFSIQFKDFVFLLGSEKPFSSIEEAFIHALLLTCSQSRQDLKVLALFLKSNMTKFDMANLRTLAREYCMENELSIMLQSFDYVGTVGLNEKFV